MRDERKWLHVGRDCCLSFAKRSPTDPRGWWLWAVLICIHRHTSPHSFTYP